MKLISLHLRNFRAHADTLIRFVDQGIGAIVGPNEAGKSSILEALAWSCYGSRALRGTVKGLRWHRAPARHVASVEFVFEVGGKRYRIERSEADAKLFEGEVPIADGISAVDTYVPKLIGMSWPEFAASFLCQQKDLARISSMGPTERQAFIRSVLGLDRIDAALKACRQRKNDLARERDGLAAGLGDRGQLARDVADATHSRDATAELGAEAWNAREAALEADKVAQGKLADSQQRAERHTYLAQNERHLRTQVETADREIERVERERQDAELAARSLETASAPLARLPELRERQCQLIEVRAAITQLEQLRAEVRNLDGNLEDTDALLTSMLAEVEAFDQGLLEADEAHLRAWGSRLEELSARRSKQLAECRAAADHAGMLARRTERKLEVIREAGPSGACPTCTRALRETYELVVESLEAELSEARGAQQQWTAEAESHVQLTEEERELSGRVPRLMEDVERGRRQAAAVESARREIARLTQERERVDVRRRVVQRDLADTLVVAADAAEIEEESREVADEIARLDALARDLVPLRASAARVGALAAERDERVAERADTIEQIGQIMAQLRELAYDMDAHSAIAEKAREASDRRWAAETENARAEEAHRAAVQQCERAEKALADYDARAGRLEELTRELRTHTAAAERLDAFRVAQASAVRPELEELTTGFVSLLTDGRHDGVTVTEDFELVLSESGVDVEVVSGGCEDVAALALRLAISQMIAQRAGHPLSLLVLDEIFGSLDDVRRGAVLSLLRRLSSIFEQIILISHVSESKDLADHVIELEYSEPDGRSYVIQSSERARTALAEVVA